MFRVWDKKSGSTIAPLQLDNIKKILWVHDAAYVLGKKEKEFQIYHIEHGSAMLLISSLNPISTSSIGAQNKLYYTQITSTPDEEVKKEKEGGYVYRWGEDNALTVFNKEYGHYEFEEIWCLEPSSGKKMPY